MTYVSIFSGIEAASVAWRPLGWRPLAFAEIEPFPCRVLAERFPDVPNLGDVTEVDWSPYRGAVDVVVGGSPCQSFSVAGNRGGLDDPRGRLMLEYVRAVRDIRPRWLVWENVPGVLSQDGGRAFGTLLGALDELGFGLAWRVLDAQFFGVAQRRRRVFLVGGPTAGRAAAVLFEPGCVPGGPGKSKAQREALARAAGQRSGGQGGGCLTPGESQAQRIYGVDGPGPTLSSRPPGTGDNTPTIAFAQNSRDEVRVINGDGQITGALAAQPGMKQQTFVCMTDTQPHATIDGETCGALSMTMHKDPPVAAYAVRMREGKPGGGKGPLVSEDVSLTLATGSDQTVFRGDADGWVVRRLTPLECERLQGFPSIVRLDFSAMTRDELIACALANGDITVDFANGKIYGHRGPGGVELDAPKELGCTNPRGYIVVHLSANGEKKTVQAHRVVYMAAYGAIPEGLVIDHVNNDKADNRLSNLQLMTPEGNSRKARLDGLYPCGEDNPSTKISAEVRQKIVFDYAQGNCTYRQLAQRYGVSKSRVGQIMQEDGWTDVDGAKDGPRYKAIGNSMAVPVMRWIGERIAEVDALEDETDG